MFGARPNTVIPVCAIQYSLAVITPSTYGEESAGVSALRSLPEHGGFGAFFLQSVHHVEGGSDFVVRVRSMPNLLLVS
ncbi:MAG: hypothetical protein R3D34_05875 [Nitratireductor sp.]